MFFYSTRKRERTSYRPRLECFESRFSPSVTPPLSMPAMVPAIQLPNEFPILETPAPVVPMPVETTNAIVATSTIVSRPIVPQPVTDDFVAIGSGLARISSASAIVSFSDNTPILSPPRLVGTLENSLRDSGKIATGSALFGVGGTIKEEEPNPLRLTLQEQEEGHHIVPAGLVQETKKPPRETETVPPTEEEIIPEEE